MYRSPSFVNFSIEAANSSASTLYAPVSGSGSPALAFMMRGRSVDAASRSAIGYISSGPREQFMPIASAPSPSNTHAIDSTHVPVNVRPLFSNDIVTKTGSSQFSLAARTPARTS